MYFRTQATCAPIYPSFTAKIRSQTRHHYVGRSSLPNPPMIKPLSTPNDIVVRSIERSWTGPTPSSESCAQLIPNSCPYVRGMITVDEAIQVCTTHCLESTNTKWPELDIGISLCIRLLTQCGPEDASIQWAYVMTPMIYEGWLKEWWQSRQSALDGRHECPHIATCRPLGRPVRHLNNFDFTYF